MEEDGRQTGSVIRRGRPCVGPSDDTSRTASWAGLAVAWGGTALLVSPASRFLGPPGSIVTACFEQAVLWLLFIAVLVIVFAWEQERLSSLWLRPLEWQSFAWAAALVAASLLVLFPVTEWLRRTLGLPGYQAGMEAVLALPAWFRLVAAMTAGVVEETLFRGYSVTRLSRLTGSVWLAAGISVVASAMLHLPMWGPGPSLAFLVGGAATTAFFVWRRDLLAMMIAHAIIDTWGLVVTPDVSQWWVGN